RHPVRPLVVGVLDEAQVDAGARVGRVRAEGVADGVAHEADDHVDAGDSGPGQGEDRALDEGQPRHFVQRLRLITLALGDSPAFAGGQHHGFPYRRKAQGRGLYIAPPRTTRSRAPALRSSEIRGIIPSSWPLLPRRAPRRRAGFDAWCARWSRWPGWRRSA